MKERADVVQHVYSHAARTEREHHARRLVWRIWTEALLANAIGGAMTALIQFATSAVDFPGAPNSELQSALVLVGGTMFVLICCAARIVKRWLITPRLAWFIHGRAATPDEMTRFASLPRIVVLENVVAWTIWEIGLLVYLIHAKGFSFPAGAMLRELATHTYGFVVATALAYVLVERQLRPYVQLLVPRERVAWPLSLALTSRLLIVWLPSLERRSP